MPLRRLSVFASPLLGLVLGACGDAREPFTGVYDLDGTFEYRRGGSGATLVVESSTVTEVVADAFDPERLYVNFECGLSATMKDDQTFTLTPKGCPQYKVEDCWYRVSYTEGVVSKGVEGDGLRLVGEGTFTMRCDNGDTDRLNFSVAVTGEKRPPSDTQPPSTGELSQPVPNAQARGLHARLKRLARESAVRE